MKDMDTNSIFKPYEGDEKYIFISYKHDDWETVSRIITDLNDRGYRIWYDEGLHGGQNFVNEIAVRIIKCEVFLSFLSKTYITSDYCVNELHYAFSKSKTVIPILLDDVDLPPEIEFQTVKINRLSLQKLGSEKALADRLCDWDREILDPCRRDRPKADIPSRKDELPPAAAPKKPKWVIPAAAAVIILAAVLYFTVFSGKGGGSQPAPALPTAVLTETAPAETVPAAPEASPAAAVRALPTLAPAALDDSAKKALNFLTERTGEGVPLSVYDTKESPAQGAEAVYDNAMAALAILSGNSGSANLRMKNVKKILDAQTAAIRDGSMLSDESSLKGPAVLAAVLLEADKAEPSVSYVMNAQTILDRIIAGRSSESGGFTAKGSAPERTAADNLWLGKAFQLMYEKTGNSSYREAARSAETFVQSLRPADNSYYLSGDGSELISAETQALAAILMNDRTGIDKASGLLRSGGCYAPDDRTEGCSLESTALMAMAFKKLGMEEEASRTLSALSRNQLSSGGIPGTDVPSMTDGQGREYFNFAGTSATAWFALAEAGTDPFQDETK